MFASSSGSPAPEPLAAAVPSLPNAPMPNLPMVRGAIPPGEQPLVLPRNFRITPAASRTNVPGKVSYYLGSTWSIRNLLEALAIAGVPNVTTAPTQPRPPNGDVSDQTYEDDLNDYGHRMDDWLHVNEPLVRVHARRFEVGLATAESRQLLSNLVLPVALHQQGRYIPAPVNSDLSQRLGNAAASIVVTHNDAGYLVPNYSKLGGTVAAAFLGKSLYASAFKAPELNSGHFVERYVGYSLLGDLATNTAHELIRAAVEPDMTMYNLHGRSTDDSYYPLSIGGKFIYWARGIDAGRNFAEAALVAGLPTVHDFPKDPRAGNPSTYDGFPDFDTAEMSYGQTVLVWKDNLENSLRYHGQRFAGGLAESESQQLLANFAIPVLFDMDPRYIPLGTGYSGSQRLGHAFQGLVVSHTDSGAKTINLPVLGGTVGAAFLAKEVYYPQFETPKLASGGVLATTIGLNFAADALGNIVGEFLRHRGY